MLRTLHRRLLLSHILPVLLIIPLTGLVLIYVLESRVLLVNLSRQMLGHAVLVEELAGTTPDIWESPQAAERFAQRVGPLFPANLMLLDLNGLPLASTGTVPADPDVPVIPASELEKVRMGDSHITVRYSTDLHAEIAEVIVPAFGENGEWLGVIRLSHRLETVYERFFRLRTLIVLVLAVGLLAGALIGWRLAVTIERPIQHLTGAVSALTRGEPAPSFHPEGPEELRLLGEAFVNLVQRLRTLERNRGQLLANLVHELGRPLGSFGAAIHALSSGAVEDVTLRRELLDGMQGEVRRLQRLLDDLAELRGRMLGTLELERESVALADWLARMLSPWREEARRKGLEWDTQIPPSLPVLEIDPDRMGQALGNLLSNAVKYTAAGGKISVSAGVEAGELWIRVNDTGIGILPEEQKTIFTPFFRSRTDRRFPQGMGLGLTIARDLVVAHGGRIEVDSVHGEGSAFTLWLPIAAGSTRG